MKTCMKCKVSKDESDFGNHHGFKCGLNSRCKSCEKTQRDAFRTTDRSRRLPRQRAYYKRFYAEHKDEVQQDCKERHQQLRQQLFQGYGGKCARCGIPDPDVLCIDHVNNNGAKERQIRRGSKFYRWLRRNNYPKGEYQLLCYNCNWKKRMHKGVLPPLEAQVSDYF